VPDWKGTPLDEHGHFMNHERPFTPKFSDVLKWQTSKNPLKKEKKGIIQWILFQ
jgi:hypothetical protein